MSGIRSLSSAALIAFVLTSAGLPAATAAETYKVDSVHSSIVFRIKHVDVAYFYGRFNEVSGTCVLDESDLTKSSIEIAVKAESVDTHDPKRDNHLKSPDFFNAKEFPEIKFKSTSIKSSGENKLEVAGELSLHGVTRPITVSVDRTGSGAGPGGQFRTGLETVFTIKRSDFGMDFMLNGLSDEVKLMISIEAIRQ